MGRLRIVWGLRGRGEAIRRLSIPVHDKTTANGARVLVPHRIVRDDLRT